MHWPSSFELALAVQILIWLGVILFFVISGQASVFHPLTIYLGFHALVFILRPLMIYFFNFDGEFRYMGIQPDETLLTRTLMITSVALVVFAIACLAFGWCQPQFQATSPTPFPPEQRRSLVILTVLLLPVIAYSIHAAATDFGGKMIGGTFVLTGASGYSVEAQLMAGPLLCLWLAVTRFRWQVVLLLIPYVGYRAYYGMARWSFVLLFVALGLMYAWQTRKKWLPWWLLIVALAIFPLFKMVGDDRAVVRELISGEYDSTAHDTTDPSMTAEDRFRMKYDNPDFANFDFLTFVVEMVPDRTQSYTYGTQYLQLFTEPIPRKLWPGKPAGPPVGFFNLNNYGDFLGRTVSLVGDGWMSGGWIGVVITMTIVGAMLGLAHRWFWTHLQNNMVALFYLVGIAMLPQWYRDGGISISKFLFWNLSPLVLWLVLTWMLKGGFVPGHSVLLPAGSRIRFVRN